MNLVLITWNLQAWIVAPIVFYLYSEDIFKVALTNRREGVKISGEIINTFRKADDKFWRPLRLDIEACQIELNDKIIDRHNNFKYLGSRIFSMEVKLGLQK